MAIAKIIAFKEKMMSIGRLILVKVIAIVIVFAKLMKIVALISANIVQHLLILLLVGVVLLSMLHQ